jgi:hypothetical protein
MSQQYDFLSGKDLSAISTILQEDVMQALNQAAPLDNIGLIIVSTTRPDITNNPRFIRYIWLDISNPANVIIRQYIGDRTVLVDADVSWGQISVSNLSILTAAFAARSITGGINVGLLKLNADYSSSGGSAFYVLRVDATGKFIEAVSLDQELLDGGLVALNRLATTGLLAGKFVGFNGGVAGYVSITPSVDLIGASRIAVETNIIPGTARFVPRTNIGATALEFITPNSLFNAGELTLDKLFITGALANDIIRMNAGATAWERVTPTLRTTNADAINSGTLSGSTVATAVHTIAHNLGFVPKLVDVRIRMTNAVADIGYNQNDEVSISGYRATTGNVMSTWCADATNITVLIGAATGELPNKGTGVYAGVDETKWFPVVRAWL